MTLSLPPVVAIIVFVVVKVVLGAAVQAGILSLPGWATFVVAGVAGFVAGVAGVIAGALWIESSLPNTNRGGSK